MSSFYSKPWGSGMEFCHCVYTIGEFAFSFQVIFYTKCQPSLYTCIIMRPFYWPEFVEKKKKKKRNAIGSLITSDLYQYDDSGYFLTQI